MPRRRAGQNRVIVVGAGIAGLTAAYTLQKRGFQVVVLEREAAAGGRMRSERHGEFVIERGAQFIASSYRNMLALADELGIAGLIEPLRNARNAVLRDGRFVTTEYEGLRTFSRSRDLSLAGKLRLLRILWPLWLHRERLDFYHPERAARLDSECAAAYARRAFGEEVLDYLVEPAFASTFTVLPEAMSRAFLLSTIATLLRGFRLLSFRGGNGVLTHTLAERLPVRLSTEVLAVDSTESGVTVRVRGGRPLKAEAAVVAVPGNAVAPLCSALTPGEREFFERVRYSGSIIVFVMAGRDALPPFYGAGISRREGVRLYGMAVENAKAGVVPPGKTLFNCALSEDMAAALMDEPDEVVIQSLRRELAKLPLRGLESVEGYAVHRWPSLVPRFYPGYHRALRRFLRRSDRSGRLFFAGDYMIGPYTEAALTSGMRAAAGCEAALTPVP
jgi:oxygen-dependent protoporphyrinogen oxidase